MEIQSFRLVITVLSVGFGTGFQIYSASVVNNLEHHLRIWLNETFADRHAKLLSPYEMDVLWAAIVSCVAVGATVGAATEFTVSKYLGRRKALFMTGILSFIGASLTGLSYTASAYEMLFTGRLLIGYALGLGMGIAEMYVTEIAPIEHRGACGAVIGLFFGMGDLVSIAITLPEGLGTEKLWALAMALPAIPAALQVLVIFLSPESPRALFLTNHDQTKTEKSLKYFQTQKQMEKTLLALSDEQASSVESDRPETTLCQFLFSPVYRKRVVLTVALNTAIEISGISAIMSYSTSILRQSGLGLDQAAKASTGIGACNFIMPIVTIFTVDRIGRRPLNLGGISGCFLSVLALTVVTGIRTHGGLQENQALSYLCIVCLIFYQISFGIAQPVTMFVTSEFFEQDVRAYGMSLANVVFFGLGALQLIAFPPFARAVGISTSFVPFVVVTAFCLFYLFHHLPETKDKSAEEIVKDMKKSLI